MGPGRSPAHTTGSTGHAASHTRRRQHYHMRHQHHHHHARRHATHQLDTSSGRRQLRVHVGCGTTGASRFGQSLHLRQHFDADEHLPLSHRTRGQCKVSSTADTPPAPTMRFIFPPSLRYILSQWEFSGSWPMPNRSFTLDRSSAASSCEVGATTRTHVRTTVT